MRRPRCPFFRHSEADQSQIPAGFVERLPAPTFDEVGHAELVLELQTALGKCIQLFLDGHASPRNSTQRQSSADRPAETTP